MCTTGSRREGPSVGAYARDRDRSAASRPARSRARRDGARDRGRLARSRSRRRGRSRATGRCWSPPDRLVEAAGAFRRALRLVARVRARAGGSRPGRCRARALRRGRAPPRSVVDRLPLPEYAILLGDALARAGRPLRPRRAYALVTTLERVLAANGVRTELSDGALRPRPRRPAAGRARSRARRLPRRAGHLAPPTPSPGASSATGRCVEARDWSQRALALGTKDGLFLFHRGMIERCLGGDAGGGPWFRRALEANPTFSLRWAPLGGEARAMRRLVVVLVARRFRGSSRCRRLRARTRSATSPSTATRASSSPAATIYVRYALDLAEIPTYQLGSRGARAGLCGPSRARADPPLDGRRVPLRVVERRVTSRPGAGGLETLRLDVVYAAEGGGSELAFEDARSPAASGGAR